MANDRGTQDTMLGLHRIAQRLRVARSTQELCRSLASSIADELSLPDVVVYGRCDRSQRYAQLAAVGAKADACGGVLAPLSIADAEGIVGHAASTALPIRVDCTQHDARYIVDDQSRLAELSVPICYDGEVLGVLDAEHSVGGFFQPFHEIGFLLAAELAAPRLADLMARERRSGMQFAQPGAVETRRAVVHGASRIAAKQVLNLAEFGSAVERSLQRIAAPQELLKSPLRDCALMHQASGANPVLQMRQLLMDSLDDLIGAPRTSALGQLLRSAYIDAPESRALLASRWHMGESTLRRRLKLARDTLIATMWAAELAERSALAARAGANPE